MARSSFGFGDFLMRWIFAQILVLATFNPTDFSYFRWAKDAYQTELPLVIFLGVVLLIGYIIFLRATLRSIGVIGIILIAALAGSLMWVLIDRGLLSLDGRRYPDLGRPDRCRYHSGPGDELVTCPAYAVGPAGCG